MHNLSIPVLALIIVIIIVVVVEIYRSSIEKFKVERSQLEALQKDWRVPAELTGSIPRPVKLTASATGLSVFLAVLVVAAMAFVVFSVWPRVERQKLRDDLLSRESVPAVGMVTRIWTTQQKNSLRYHVAYTYSVLKKIYDAEADVSRQAYTFLKVRHSVGLRYAASRPDLSMLDGEIVTPAWPFLFVFIPVIVSGIVLAFVALKQKKLLETGQPAGAIVTSSMPTKGGRSVSYQFLDSDGNTVSGNVKMKTRIAPNVGKTVTVVYDPDNPKHNTIYPAQYVRIRNSELL